MHRDALLAAWRREEQAPFSGWDFSRLRGRMLEDEEPWSYPARATELLDHSSAVLDMDTGGGERLLTFKEHWPATVVATEAYTPNVVLARDRLTPLGVAVVETNTEPGHTLPFESGAFDLVLNRHGAFDPVEVARVLAPGGTFFAQQVGSRNLHDLATFFGGSPQEAGDSVDRRAAELVSAGLGFVDVRDWTGTATFVDVGALVYFLHAIPWVVPGFAVDTHAEQLLALQEKLERGEPITFTIGRSLIEARKPA